MKKYKIISGIAVLFMVMISSATVMAVKPVPGTSEALRSILSEHISFPEFAKETNLTGFVVVSLEVAENGKINIKGINASDPKFQENFMDDIAGVNVKNAVAYTGKTFYYRFDYVTQNYS